MKKIKLGILDELDTKGMTQDDLEKWNALDEAVGEAFRKKFPVLDDADV